MLRQERTEKSISPWDPIAFTVTNICGSMITATRPDKIVTRNSSFFKLKLPIEEDEEIVAADTRDSSASSQLTPFTEDSEEAEMVENSPAVPHQSVQQQHILPCNIQPTAQSNSDTGVRNRRGRPTMGEAAAIKEARERQEREKREANPPVRASARLAEKNNLQKGGKM